MNAPESAAFDRELYRLRVAPLIEVGKICGADRLRAGSALECDRCGVWVRGLDTGRSAREPAAGRFMDYFNRSKEVRNSAVIYDKPGADPDRVGATRAVLKRCAKIPDGLRRIVTSSLRDNFSFLRGGATAAAARLRFSRVLLRNFLRLRNLFYARSLACAGVSPQGFSVVGDELRVEELGISISRDSAALISHIPDALLLSRGLRVRFSNVRDTIVASSGDFAVHVSSGEELFILREVLMDGVYNFGLPAEGIVVWDVGMNVGIASLYFAARPDVRAVLGFEPFQPTFEAAKRNFELNPTLSLKIRPHNYGVAGVPRFARASYLSSWKGSVGVDGIRKEVLDRVRFDGGRVTAENVELLGADCVLRSIVKDYPDSAIVAKIDCEGSEYEIIRCLDESNLLGELSVVMLEWHERGPRELERILRSRGFSTFSQLFSSKLGLIYAAKYSKRAKADGS